MDIATLLVVAALLSLSTVSACKDDPGPRSEDLDSVASACMLATACDVQAYARIGACMYTFSELRVQWGEAAVMAGIYQCVNSSTSCSEVRECFGAGAFCNSSVPAQCDGDTAVYCDLLDGVTYRYECGDHGLGCRLDPDFTHRATCTPREEQPGASGHHLSFDLHCDGVLCERTGEPCSDDDLDACSGRHVVACVEGETILFDCYALGLRACLMEENDWGHCQPQLELDE